jgi:hypothetical protein
MSLDDRIRELSESIIREVRAPIEASLHEILSEVATLASEDREAAIRTALSTASAEHEAAIAELKQQGEQARVGADAQRAQLERDREAGEAALRETLAREKESALDSLRSEHEAALSALRQSLVSDHEAAVAELQLQFEHERTTALNAVGEEHERHVVALRDELTIAHESAMDGMMAAEKGQAQVRADLASRVDTLERELRQARSEAADGLASATGTSQRLADTEQRLAGTEQQLRAAEQKASDAEERLRAAEQKAGDAEERLRAAEQKAGDAEERLHAAEQKAGAAEAEAMRLSVAHCDPIPASSDRTLTSLRSLDAAQSLTEVMEILADQAAAEIGRAVLLVVHGSRLRAWCARGLSPVVPGAIEAPIEPGSLFGLVTTTALPASADDAPLGMDGTELATLLAAPAGHAGLAVPITIGGRVAAILYADTVGASAPTAPAHWAEVAEVLARHAGQRLEVLTLSHAAALAGGVPRDQGGQDLAGVRPSDLSQADERREEESARRYARLLISEIKLYNEPAVEQGRERRDLLGRLGPDIERARRLYEERIPAAVRRRVNCFDQEVVRTLAGGDPGLLGQT